MDAGRDYTNPVALGHHQESNPAARLLTDPLRYMYPHLDILIVVNLAFIHLYCLIVADFKSNINKDDLDSFLRPEALDTARVEDLVKEYFRNTDKVLLAQLKGCRWCSGSPLALHALFHNY